MLPLHYYTLSLFLGGFIALLSGLVVYLSDRKKLENIAWLALNITTAIWSFGYFSMISSNTQHVGMISNWVLHGGAIFIPVFYFLFTIAITGNYERYKYIFALSSFIALGFLVLNTSELFISSVFPKYIFSNAPDAGPLYIYFTIYFFFFVLLSLVILGKQIIKTEDWANKTKLRYVFYSSLFGFAGGGSVFLLTFNIPIPPYPIILFSLFPIVIAIAVVKHHLFGLKVVVTELLTFILWIVILARTLISSTAEDVLINGGLLVASVILGIFLIRSVLKDVEARELIQGLAKKLEGANSELEGANEKLKKLDRQKSEFVSIASHQLRSPLTVIKGYLSMFIEGEPALGNVKEGSITPKGAEVINTMFQSTNRLAHIIEDFLNVSRIEQGRMKYEMSDFDIRQMTMEVVNEFNASVEQKGLTIAFSDKTSSESYMVSADPGKIRQVIGNVIDNSIKYTPQGGITVYIERLRESIRISVRDTGIGISAENLKNLFQKFSRAANAGKVNVTGSGLGLFVAVEIMKAHNGKLYAESEGEGKGSTFVIELPLKPQK